MHSENSNDYETSDGFVSLVIKNADGVTPDLMLGSVPLHYSVLDVKKSICDKYAGNPPPGLQKLVYSGRLLKDSENLDDVVMAQGTAAPVVFHVLVRSTTSATVPIPSAKPVAQKSEPSQPTASRSEPTPSSPYPEPVPTRPEVSAAPGGLAAAGAGFVPHSAPAPLPDVLATSPMFPTTPQADSGAAPWMQATPPGVGYGFPPMSQHAAAEQVYQVYYQAYYAAYLAHFSPPADQAATPDCPVAPMADLQAAPTSLPTVLENDAEPARRPEAAADAVPEAEARGVDLLPGARAQRNNNNNDNAEQDVGHDDDFGERRQNSMLLALKLAFFVWALGQDAPKERMYALVVCAIAIFLHQTGYLRLQLPFGQQPPQQQPQQQQREMGRVQFHNDDDDDDEQGERAENEDEDGFPFQQARGPAMPREGGGDGLSGLLVDVMYLFVGFFTSLVPTNQQEHMF
mmetsp:Transcript_5407/g.10897  ORF Transcript_5407/g.10897 Transcript_5407/m.10897 type:complete len:458 (+) Transcript_5407:60-1433(+)